MLFLAGTAACLLAYFFARDSRNLFESRPFSASLSTTAPELTREVQPAKNQRIVYPYSVIPGGAHNPEELSASMNDDPVVAVHYAGFRTDRARMIKAEETRFVHVSYRVQDRVFWTAATVKLPKGETLITDGHEVARARCGNKVSAVALGPVSEEEPAVEAFDMPMVAELEKPEPKSFLDLVREPGEFLPLEPSIPMRYPMIQYPAIQYPPIVPYYHPPDHIIYPPPDDIVVPEPGALGLLASGLFILLMVKLARKKRPIE